MNVLTPIFIPPLTGKALPGDFSMVDFHWLGATTITGSLAEMVNSSALAKVCAKHVMRSVIAVFI